MARKWGPQRVLRNREPLIGGNYKKRCIMHGKTQLELESRTETKRINRSSRGKTSGNENVQGHRWTTYRTKDVEDLGKEANQPRITPIQVHPLRNTQTARRQRFNFRNPALQTTMTQKRSMQHNLFYNTHVFATTLTLQIYAKSLWVYVMDMFNAKPRWKTSTCSM